jgi:hypothetical protein
LWDWSYIYPPLRIETQCELLQCDSLALRELLLTDRMALASFMVAGLVHAADVAHNVFKAF